MMQTSPIRDELRVAEELKPWNALVRGRKFLWILSPTWDGVWTRQNHFATRLARLGAEVLYVENPSSWASSLKQRQWKSLPLLSAHGTKQVEPRLHVMKPFLSFPGATRSEIIARINGRLVASQIEQWTRSRRWGNCVAWCRLPHSFFALDRFQPQTTVYDITDDYAAYETNSRIRRRVKTREEALLERADLVFVAARPLLEKVRCRQSYWIPNGVEYELFAQASQPGEIHPLVAAMGRPVIGFVGLTSHWMDFDLLTMLGSRWPNQILMLGPIAANVEKRARSIRGVVWGGFVPQPNLPPYIRGFDVCIMPYLVSDRTRASSPLKMWEYIATGKPFVSVDLPACDPVREFVDVAHNTAHFVKLVEQRLSRGSHVPSTSAAVLAKRHSWDAIFQKVLEHLATKL